MKTYVINLKNATDRKVHMNKILSRYPILDIEFVDAVDGRNMPKEILQSIFDFKKAAKNNYRIPEPPEIGCTMSHVECYKRLLHSGEKEALILEDDIEEPDTYFYKLLPEIKKRISNHKPQIILLSDWYWYTKSYELGYKHQMVSVVNAYLTHAYLINRKAAEMLTRNKPCHIADNWQYIKKTGIELFAIKPHLIQQKWTEDFKTSIQNKSNADDIVKRLPKSIQVLRLWFNIKSMPNRIFLRLIKSLGYYYEPHSNKSKWEKNSFNPS